MNPVMNPNAVYSHTSQLVSEMWLDFIVGLTLLCILEWTVMADLEYLAAIKERMEDGGHAKRNESRLRKDESPNG
jgi:hypothetical protein